MSAFIPTSNAWVAGIHQTQRATCPKKPSRHLCMNTAGEDMEIQKLKKAMLQAKQNEQRGESPGAGLQSAEEAAMAAFADMINTSAAQQNKELTDEEIADFASRGGKMWEKNAKQRKSKGFFGDLTELLGALGGGAHIVKDEDGRV